MNVSYFNRSESQRIPEVQSHYWSTSNSTGCSWFWVSVYFMYWKRKKYIRLHDYQNRNNTYMYSCSKRFRAYIDPVGQMYQICLYSQHIFTKKTLIFILFKCSYIFSSQTKKSTWDTGRSMRYNQDAQRQEGQWAKFYLIVISSGNQLHQNAPFLLDSYPEL